MPDLQSAALDLAREGTAVFPVGLDKKPRNTDGFHGATTDPEKIKKWQWEGIGAAVPEGTFVVDIDPRNNGAKSRDALALAGCKMPATRTVTTQGGGTHRYYKLPKDMQGKKLKSVLAPGIDIKAPGKGYVLVPPTPGYVLQFETPIAEAPDWMLEEILVEEKIVAEHAVSSKPKFFQEFEIGTAYGRTAQEMELGRLAMATEGTRNNTLNKATFALAQLSAGGEIEEEQCIRCLIDMGMKIGLDHDEVKQTVVSGWSAGIQEPRSAPPTEQAPDKQPPSVLMHDPVLDDSPHELGGLYQMDVSNVDLTPPPFYLHPLIPKNAYVLVYGAADAAKSIVMLGLASQGSHQGLKSSFYSLENPDAVDARRILRFDANLDNLRMFKGHLDLYDADQVQNMMKREKEFGTDWLVLDTYSHAFFGWRGEDGNAKAIHFAVVMRRIMQHVGCSIIVIDHTGYADHGEPRDASAKRQQVDVAIKMVRDTPWEPGSKRAVFSMENMKPGRFGNPFNLHGTIRDGADDSLSIEWTLPEGHALAPKWQLEG